MFSIIDLEGNANQSHKLYRTLTRMTGVKLIALLVKAWASCNSEKVMVGFQDDPSTLVSLTASIIPKLYL